MQFGTPPTTFAYYLGFHFTDEGLLAGSLAKDREVLAENGVSFPRHKDFGAFLEGSLNRYKDSPNQVEDQMELYDLVNIGMNTKRIVISNADILCPKRRIFDHEELYAKAAYRSTWIRNLFPENPCEFHLSVVHPLLFLRDYFAQVEKQQLTNDVLQQFDFASFWDTAIGRIRFRNPDCPIFVSRLEDRPLIWRDFLASICDIDQNFRFSGAADAVSRLLTPHGAHNLTQALADAPDLAADQYTELFAHALERYGPEDEPGDGFDPYLWEEVSDAYTLDIEALSQRHDVFVID